VDASPDARVRTDASSPGADAGVRTGASTQALDGATPPPAREDEQTPVQPAQGSCFGRCGMPELLAEPGTCACDPACFARGDCCTDKHELCAVSARAPLCTLTGKERDPALCGTDLGWSFAHDGKLEVLFGDSYGSDCTDPYPNDDSQGSLPLVRPAYLPTALPGEPVACDDLLQLDKKRALLGGETFAPIVLYQDGTALSSYLGETPLTGFSDGANAYLMARRGSTIDNPIYIGVRDPGVAPSQAATRTSYRALVETDAPHLRNPTAVTVASFDPARPEAHDWSAGTGSLLLFGRGNFSGPDARDVYLAQHTLPLVQPDGSASWAPVYFTGLQAGAPTWSADVAQAVPVLANDFERTMQFDVAWVPALDKWVMLYGGDVADWIENKPDNQPRHGALHMRMADAPWGPWTRATPVFWREHAAAFMHCDAPADSPTRAGCDVDDLPDDPEHSYSVGSWAPQLLDFPGCISGDLRPSQPNFVPGGVLPCTGAQRGNLYAASFVEPWTADLAGDQGYPHAATLYFLVSTWMPYQVILASLTVHLP
jgi:Somatomedin B domain